MDRKLAGTCSYAVLILALTIGVVAVATGNNLVSAQPCTAQLGSPSALTQQYLTFQVTVPVSATCPFNAGQLYATGTAYDTVYNSNIGTANTALSGTYGGYGFSGQLLFNLPTSAVSHPVQFSVSIYSAQPGYYQYYGGSLLTSTSATFVLGPSYLNSYQNYPYPYYSTYPTYPTYPGYVYYPGNYYYYSYPYYNQYRGGYYYYYRNGGYYYNHRCSGKYCNHH